MAPTSVKPLATSLPVEVSAESAAELSPSVLTRLPDEALMALVARGDPSAFEVLYDRHVRAALALATQMCRRRAIAEEVVQEAFLSFWRSRGHFDRRRGNVRAWVLGIVRNRAIDVLRQSVAHDLADANRQVDDLLEARECTDHEVGRREGARELLAALGGLPPEQSCVITLAYYGGYTHTEIANMLNTPIGTIKGRMRLGLRKMAVAGAGLR
ncbi:MAG TPA: sigma-70 family RNA polymerase sigma factor [Solirubrobacteraceae bacterium]